MKADYLEINKEQYLSTALLMVVCCFKEFT